MRLSVLTILLLGCGNNASEITVNPRSHVTIDVNENDEVETHVAQAPNFTLPVTIHLSCAAPPAEIENDVATYNIDSILDSSGCEEHYANYLLSFSPGAKSVPFSCNSEAFTWWHCDLPLVNGVQKHRFTFGDMDGSETEYEPLADPLIISECSGRELGIVFWATREGANTLCADDDQIDRGFQDVEFPTKAASIVLSGSL